jgi:hypothetical protein
MFRFVSGDRLSSLFRSDFQGFSLTLPYNPRFFKNPLVVASLIARFAKVAVEWGTFRCRGV